MVDAAQAEGVWLSLSYSYWGLAVPVWRGEKELYAGATRISKEVFGLASRLAARGIAVERMPERRQRGIRLSRR